MHDTFKGNTALVSGAGSGIDADAALFLRSEGASFMTGSAVVADGGYTAA